MVLTASLIISLVSATIAVPTLSRALKELDTERETRHTSDEKIVTLEQELAKANRQIKDLQAQLADSLEREQQFRRRF